MLLLIFNYFIYRELEDSVIDVFLTVLLIFILKDLITEIKAFPQSINRNFYTNLNGVFYIFIFLYFLFFGEKE